MQQLDGLFFFVLSKHKRTKIAAIYFLIDVGEIVYIGETSDLDKRREAHRKDKKFDEVFYVDAAGVSDEKRRYYEEWTLVQYRKFYGRLPKYNKTNEEDTPFMRVKFNERLGMKYETRLEHQLSRSEYADRPTFKISTRR